MQPTVVIDVESTGFVVAEDRLYEICILTLDGKGDVAERYETLLRPVDAELSARMSSGVAHAPTFAEVAGDVLSRLRRGVVVGHNVSFDLSMIEAELARLGGLLPDVEYIDTLDLATRLAIDAPSRRLAVLSHVLGIEMPSWHTAAGDAEATRKLFLRLLEIAASRGLERLTEPSNVFKGNGPAWPELPTLGHAVTPRDVARFPASGERPENVNTLESWDATRTDKASVTVDLESLFGSDMVVLAVVRQVLRETDDRSGWPDEIRKLAALAESDDSKLAAGAAKQIYEALVPDPARQARQGWRRGNFVGDHGIERLREIADSFDTVQDDELSAVKQALATMLRYESGHGRTKSLRHTRTHISQRQTGTSRQATSKAESLTRYWTTGSHI